MLLGMRPENGVRMRAMSSNHLKTVTCSTFASRLDRGVRLSQPARRLMTWGVTATHDSASLRPSRWIFALRRTRLVLIAAAVALRVLWMLGTISAGAAAARCFGARGRG